MGSQVENYTKNVLKVVVAQVCQIIGWNSIHQSSLEVLVDTLDRFMQELTKQTYRITELYQRTEPTLDDLALAFHYLNLNMNDIKEYIDYVGPPERIVPAIPKYPAAPPQILNIKMASDDMAEPSTSASDVIQPKAEDSDEEEQFKAFFQYNREYKTEITGGPATGEDGGVEVKREDNGDGKANTSTEDSRMAGDSKQDVLKKAPLPGRIPIKRKLVSVQLTPGGRIQGVREGRMPGADLPQIFLNEIEAAASLEQQGNDYKASKSKSHHKQQHHEPNGGASNSSRAGTPSFPSIAPAAASSSIMASHSKRDKLSQETDRVKSNIFKKISQPHKHSPQQTFTTATPIVQHQPPPPPQPVPVAQEVIDIDSSPNPPPIHSPVPHQHPAIVAQQSSSGKREKKEKKKKEKSHREQPHQQPFLPQPDSSLLGIPQLPAGTTLEAIPMKVEKEPYPSAGGASSSSLFPGDLNYALPLGTGLIPLGGGGNNHNMAIPPVLAGLANRMPPGLIAQLSPKIPPAAHSPKRKDKEIKKQKQQQHQLGASNIASLMPSNLFLPDTTVRVETVIKQETQITQETRILSPVVKATPPPTIVNQTIDLLSDDDVVDARKATAVAPPTTTQSSSTSLTAEEKAAAKKAEKQKKKEQRRLEKLAAAAGGANSDKPMNLSADGGTEVVVKKEKPSKMERKMEKMLLKKMLKSKKVGDEGGPEQQPIDMSLLDQEKQRKMEKKLKKLQKSNKAKLKAQAAAEEAERAAKATAATNAALLESEKKAAELLRSPEPLLLPKLTLKLNSPKVGDMMHSPKEAAAHSSKDYRPLTVDTGDVLMTPVKRVKTGSAHNSPLGGGNTSVTMLVEPELAKISPLVTRPMKQHHSDVLASPSSSGRGRPKGSTNKTHSSSSALPPPVIPIKQEESASVAGGGGSGNQVWICPACGRVDDGSPMIGCDGCDNWYHWLCVGIHVAPESSEDWFCRVCIMQRKEMAGEGLGFADLAARKKEKKKRKKEKKMKMETGSD